ncbi:hypothetical protein [Sphingomonas sp. Leaf242]|nr:hypothetical protein [Sphingomonas sp. Leaf242]
MARRVARGFSRDLPCCQSGKAADYLLGFRTGVVDDAAQEVAA